MPFQLSLSPNVRLRMTVQNEMQLDPDGRFYNDDLYQKYLSMHREALARQQGQAKALAMIDAGLALVIFGKNVAIPGFGLSLQDIPAALEVLTALASFTFMMLSLSFLNVQCYQAIIEQFNIRKAKGTYLDPDFITAADTFTELYLKAFRPQMNIHGPDFFSPGKGFRIYFQSMVFLMITAMFLVLLIHLALVSVGAWQSFTGKWISAAFCLVIVLLNVVGILANLMVGFNFTVDEVLNDGSSATTVE